MFQRKHVKKSNPHSWFKKNLNKLRIEGKLCNLMKDIYEKLTAKIILNGERLKAFPHKIRVKKAKVSTINTFVQHHAGGSSRYKSEKKTQKTSSPVWEGRNKIIVSLHIS